MLKVFSFDASTLDGHLRLSAWNEALGAFGAKAVGDASQQNFLGSISGLRTAWGFSMVRLHISAQHLSIDTPSLAGGIWLARIVRGEGTLRTERGSMAFAEGDLIVGKVSRELRLTANVATCIDYVQFAEFHNGSRLSSLATPAVALLLAKDHGSTGFLADLLTLATGRIGKITGDEIRPLEITLVEFLMAATATTGAAGSVIDGSRTRNAMVLRATQAIELKLSDPDLSAGRLADYLGISLRYLQKLFEDAGENPNHYIRRRRLERSYQDLSDALYLNLSIAEISYRWGFNDSAYFSRAFRERYGVSPSQHRDHWRWREAQCPKPQTAMRMPLNPGLRIAR